MSAPLRRAVLPACLMAALASPAAFADAGLGLTQLDAVEVTAEKPDDYVAGSTESATRLELTPRETPQSVSVITRRQLDDFGLDNLNEVLANTPGVVVEQVETDRVYFTARGFDITNFQRDGLGLPLPYGIQNGDLDTAIYERIEVLRGANGLMSGTGNPSATVNFVRKRPTREFSGGARLGVGSWDTRRVDLDVGGPLTEGGAVRGRAVAAWQDGDSYLDRYQLDKTVFYGVVEADLGPGTTLALGASRQENSPTGNLWGALPLFYTNGTPTDYDVSTSTSADWSFWDSADTRAFVELSHAMANGWTLRAAVNHEETEQESELFYVYGTPDADTGLGLFAYPSAYGGRFRALYADVYASGPMRLAGRDHDVVVGVNYADGNNRELSWYGNDVGTPLAPGQAFDGSYPKPVFNAYSDGSDFDYGRDSLYATVRWNLADNAKLITGLNHTRVDTEGFSYGESNTVDESRTTPFAGMVFDLGPAWSLYASYGEIFSQQSELDADNRLVGPIEGSNAEIGLKGEWFEGGLNATLAAFRADQDNLAEYAGFDAVAGRSYYAGVDARSQGVEFDLAGRVGEHWQIAGGFTVLDVEGNDGQDVRTYVPRKLLRLSAVVDVPAVPGLRLGANLRWQDDIHRDAVAYDGAGNATPLQIRQSKYALLGLMASYEVSERWSATLNVDNLTDEKYLPSLYWEQGFYGAPRNATLSIAYRF